MSDPANNREALKELRQRQGAVLDQAQARLKEQVKQVNALTKALREGPKTVPALAEATDLPTQTVFWHIIALKKYGKVVEGEQEDDYYLYQLSEQ